jgi:hypothetical protein
VYETKLKTLIDVGYVTSTDTLEKISIKRAMKVLKNNVLEYNGNLFLDREGQKALNSVALTGITLAATANAASKIENIMDANTWINAGSSSNYTCDTGAFELKATATESPCVVVSNAVTIATDNYVVLKTDAVLGTGAIKYEISRNNGVTFKQIYSGYGSQLFDLPAGTNIVLKFTITGNAVVKKFGLSFR